MPLKRLFNRFLAQTPPGDLALDEWAPVPVSAAARPRDTMEWLLKDDGDVLPLHPGLIEDDVATLQPTLPRLEPEPDPPQPDYLQYFSPEELAIIEQQRAAPSRAEPEPQPEPEPSRSRWVDLLRTCGEHLSEAELCIIRQQLLASS